MIKKAVVGMILNENNEILLLKRGKKSRYEPGKWELCGGQLEEGEPFEEALQREAFEELNISVQITKELIHGMYSDMGDGVEWEVVVYEATTFSTPEIQEHEKCEELNWVSKQELIDRRSDLATHLQEDLARLNWL